MCGAPEAVRRDVEKIAQESLRRRPKTAYGRVVPEWARRLHSLEEAAVQICWYHGELINPLLRTEDYARALAADEDDVDLIVEAQLARQRSVFNDDPPSLVALLPEAALRLQVGGADVMRGQLGRLLDLSRLQHVSLRVMPFERGAHGAHNLPFTLLRFAEGVGVDIVYREDLMSAAYLDRPDDLARQRYVELFAQLVDRALPAIRSSRFIDSVRREL